MNTLNFKFAASLSTLAAAVALSACGSSDKLVITGTAAKGAALSGNVSATCASGTGVATVQSGGNYRVEVINGAGPCLLEFTPSSGGAKLYSVTTGTGSSAVANITPLTNLFVQNFLVKLDGATAGKTSAADWFAQPAAQSLLASTTAVTTLVNDYFLPEVAKLPGASGATSLGTGFLSTTFVPVAGNAQDDLLEALATQFDPTTLQPTPAVSTAVTTAATAAPEVSSETTGGSFASGGN